MIYVYGYSDDLIEIEGEIREEFTSVDGEPYYIATSNGFVLKVTYDGEWNIKPKKILADGTDTDFWVAGSNEAIHYSGNDYSDVFFIHDAVTWVVGGTDFADA